MDSEVFISNQSKFEKIKDKFKTGGTSKIHIVADFDNTLVRAYINGVRQPALIALLRDGNYLTEDYATKAHALYNRYSQVESDPSLSPQEKEKAMQEWWKKHFDLLIKSGLNINDIKKVIDSGQAKLRDGSDRFLAILKEKQIPLVIISASGLGVDAISYFLEKSGYADYETYIISNRYKWDKDGRAVGVEEPIIHSLNKDETTLAEFSFYDKIKDRKNVILLGDNLDDPDMANGFDYENIVKVGFLNDKVEEKLDTYKKLYDVVTCGDGTLDFVNEFLGLVDD